MSFLQAAVMALTLSGNPGGEMVLLDFHADWCSPCQQMHPVVDRLAAMGRPVKKINIDQDPTLAKRFGVSQIPCFIMLVDGRVVDRQVGATSFERLEQMYKKGLAARSAAGSAPLASQAHAPAQRDTAGRGSWTPGQPASFEQPAAGANVSDARLVAASVRIRVRDPNGNSCGSGTLIDARDGEALILTCGHLFRDSKGKGAIEVDLFGPASARSVKGNLLGYDLETDVALVSIHAPGQLTTARVAPPGYKISTGDRVINVGCTEGADPTVRHSRVTALDRYLGPANIEVAGAPVEGRSGGGLFSEEGYVIGVCNAADPAENEGLYAALKTIHTQIDKTNPRLSFVYQPQGASAATLAAAEPPRMPKEMVPIERPASGAAPAAFDSPGVVAELEPLGSDERAAMDEIHRRKAEGAEVICVIRSRSNPNSPSEILVLDHASPAFLRQLAAQSRSMSAQEASVLEAAAGQARLPRPIDQQTTSVRGTPGLPLHSSNRTLPAAAPPHSDWEPRWLEPNAAGR